MAEDKELDSFLQHCTKERDNFIRSALIQKWPADMMVRANKLVDCFDEMRAQLRKPLYKPLLGTKLAFPENWGGISIVIAAGGADWKSWKDAQALADYANSGYKGPWDKFVFFTWDELQNALQGPESENRQLHVMADLISWCCVGTGGVQLPTSQIQMF